MAYETLQIEKICRTCLCENQDMRSVFNMDEGADQTTRLFEMLMSCASVQINEDDGLPAQVCLRCVDNIKRAFSFKQLCESSDHTLHNFIFKSEHNCIEEAKPYVTQALDTEPIPQFLLESDMKQLEDGEDTTHEEGLDNKIEFMDNRIDFGIAPREEDNEKVVEKLENCVENKLIKCKKPDETDIPLYPCEHCLDSKIEFTDNKIDFGITLREEDNEKVVEKFENCVEKELGKCKKLDETDIPLYPCEHCSACFTMVNDFKVHQKMHRKVVEHKCKVCNREFASSSTLSKHLKVHVSAKRHLCNECGKGFTRSEQLTSHLRIHTVERPHVCTVCGKGYTAPASLTVHTRTHSGEKPYVCTVCGKGFSVSYSLRVHTRTHSGERPFCCTLCGRGCISSSQLKKHMRKHTGEKPYQCNLCPKAYPQPEALSQHVKTHTGNRNHVCSICNKGFYQAYALKDHMRIHTGEKPYTCKICNKAFSQTGNLSKHMKKTHSPTLHSCT